MRKDDVVPVIVTSSDPGAGVEISVTVPAGERWIVKSASVTPVFATQTPWPSLVIDDGANIYFRSLCGTATLTAGVSPQCSWSEGAVALGGAGDTARQGSLPVGMVVPGGHRIRTVTAGIGANCDYGPLYLQVEKV